MDDQPGGVVIRFITEGQDVPSDEDIVQRECADKLRAFIALAEDLLAGLWRQILRHWPLDRS
ncbi:hypothetical protein EIB18_03150 [Caulobacter vibrioides]|uniref:Uncharacterized protein n=1 Tax=Caulobacter vibrioides (strain NA1000 / CB15N) TaxID=565050 RepID=A0A0H3C7E4_CAUVN|nr:hypothetical protein [Caulobacter vibrioides]YP_002515995.1 hypothetical protein CCNA_00622 [Caulobacter vibrioides NA1000]ACL94087.1 hypothetical protein CCNA_00622 [Caulobacter vibrioides NA1000]ATC23585.1 hypothetical protein CA608_03075 [Caulobacter vibrioides]ATC27431.1 hypothetical protein CA607_03130 [Caulobacter vibrioides]AZH11809.1 hypothetical protein EIB18_03150 [Caulobacter vibrioides]PLR11822.1 hypothetical protein CVUC_10500 [Caulobacter vibrioides]